MKNVQALTSAEALEILQGTDFAHMSATDTATRDELRVIVSTRANIEYIKEYLPKCFFDVDAVISQLIERFGDLLTEMDLMQIVNAAPASPVQLFACLEQCNERFSEDDLLEMLDIINSNSTPIARSIEDIPMGDASAA